MKLRTHIPLQPSRDSIDYQNKLLLVGSCFSENIGGRLQYFKFDALQNPFGILFHPLAIQNLLERSLQDEGYADTEVFFHNERWHCYDAHSKLSATSKETLLAALDQSLSVTKQQLQQATHVIITLGTAWVYRHRETEKVVANCHKVPQQSFVKELLSVADVETSLQSMISSIHHANKNAQVIFTVSPVRHIKDGFVENQQSKAHLLAAVHQIVSKHTGTHYFPSYELMMDELRDYRFYERDLVHPNELAIDYIWERFQEVWIAENTSAVMKEVDAIQKGLQHRPFNADSEQHQNFITGLHARIAKLQEAFPEIQF